MRRKRDSMSYYESILRRERLYPEPYPENALSLEELQEKGFEPSFPRRTSSDTCDTAFCILRRKLTSRQVRILRLRLQGMSLRQIARVLKVSHETVRRDFQAIRM